MPGGIVNPAPTLCTRCGCAQYLHEANTGRCNRQGCICDGFVAPQAPAPEMPQAPEPGKVQ